MDVRDIHHHIKYITQVLDTTGAMDDLITVEKAHIEAIMSRFTLLNTICESMPDGVFVKDLQGRVIMTNNAGPRNIEKQVEDILGKAADDIFPAESAQRIIEEDKKVIDTGHIQTFESCEVISGVPRSFITTKIPYKDEQGEIIGVVGLTRDITEQKEIEKIRQDHEARFRELLEAAPDAIVGIDTTGNIAVVNKQMEIMFGYDRDELIGRPVESLIPERFRKRHVHHRAGYMDAPRTRPMGSDLDLSALRKDGSEFPVEISLSPLKTEEGLFITSIIRDITDRKQLEEQLRQHTISLEEQVLHSERLATIGRMAAQVAHEIRNPLSSIGLNIELLADEINAHAWEGRLEAAELIRVTLTEIERLNNVISDYLQFARMPTKQVQDISMNDIVDELHRFIKPEATQYNVRIQSNLVENLKTIKIDPVLFRQAVLNCIINALESMPRGGVLSFTTSLQDDRVVLEINDTGYGIQSEDLSKVFDPFYSTKDRGTGLGLPYVRQIVTEFGGEVELESSPGEGTTILVQLPGSQETQKGE